ncbi:MAG: cytochrome P450 [Actinobacteria bacterium]|nr:MAG: cytochrome P450 [Actinomycetota bacterium]
MCWTLRVLPPGPRVPPLVNALRYARDPLRFFPRLRERYGDVFTVSFPDFRKVVYLAEPSLVRELFTGDPAQLHAGEANATLLEPAVGPSSVLTLDDDEHLRQRKLLLPPFHGKAVEAYREIIHAAARRDLATWPVGEPFGIRPHTQSITLDVILRAVYGLDDPARFERARQVVGAFAKRSDALMLPAFMKRGRRGPWGRFIRSRQELDALVYEEIALRRAESNGDLRDDVLSLLMRAEHDDGSPLSDRELRDELVTVVGAGHETTATALAWAVERLVRHPEAMERLRTDEDGTYTDAVIRETLRSRIAGYELPAGKLVLASITGLHAREDLYPDADAFRPERFLGEPPGTYTWIPFGGGVRRCLGAAFAQEELRIVLREIATRADLRPADPNPERPRMRNVTIAPEHEGRVVLERPIRATGNPQP